jgi:ATP-binding cassette subfamily B protein
MFKILVDEVLQPADFTAFPPIAATYLGLALAMAVVGFASNLILTWVSETFELSLRTQLFDHLHTLSMDFFERRRLGDILNRVSSDVSAIEALVLSGVTSATSAGLRLIVFGTMLFVINPPLTATALVVSPFIWVAVRVFSGRLKAASRLSRWQYGQLASIAEESLSTVALVQAYHQQGEEVRRFEEEGRRVRRTGMWSARLHGAYRPALELVELCALLLVVGYGTWQLGHQMTTLGGLLVFLAYLSQLYSPLKELGQLSNTYYTASAGGERIIEIFDAHPNVTESPDPEPLDQATGVIEFRDVSFTYPGRDRPAVQHVSFTARPGQVIAIVGRSGSGKSTLGKLLLRFYDPTSGAIHLDGHDLRALRLDDLRRNVALVMQETLVTDGTILDNIRWGRPDATDDDVARAVAASDIDTMLADLPDGLQTRIGYRGRQLSGGQRQRVAVARAMVRDAPVLLLDEPATGLDTAAEQRIMQPLHRLMGGRTTVLISHDLGSVRNADLILVIDSGQVVESGTHTDLVTSGGLYHEMWLGLDSAPDRPGQPMTSRL